MEKNEITNIVIDANQTVLCTEIFQEPQRLTPTGKISHAKTRVYTQRYRKEWEQMPDFKGWLTSVPCQATRAFCTYCKKNLHAHRLSLLKHTCTMKHQRAALMYQADINEKKASDNNGDGKMIDFHSPFEQVNVQSIKTQDSDEEDEDEEENDFDYVVERLEMEEEEEEENNSLNTKIQLVNNSDNDDEPDNDDDDGETNHYQLKLVCSNDENSTPCNKKIKLDTNERRDALAEAMAHVHGEYLDNDDDDDHHHHHNNHDNEQLDMVVESVDQEPLNNNINNSNNSESNSIVGHESDVNEVENINNKKSLQNIKENLTGNIMANCSSSSDTKLVAYPINSPQLSFADGQLQQQQQQHGSGGATLRIAPIQNKTIMLSTGKTVTLTTGKLPTGYVLSKVKGNLPTFVMTGGNKSRPILPKSHHVLLSTQSQYELGGDNVVAGPSQNVDKKMSIVKNIPITPARISTHVLDTSKGVPIGGLQVSLYKLMDGRWTFLNESTTSPSGRCTDLVDMKKSQITAGRYKIHFDVDKYFTLRRIETMYPFIEIVFDVKNPSGNYHIPILLSPFSYTTYRGTEK